MNDSNLDVNLLIQSFQERISQLMTEVVLKDATIKHLSSQLASVKTEQKETLEKKDK